MGALSLGIEIRYSETKIEVRSVENPKEIETVLIPPELLGKVKNFMDNPRPMAHKELKEIREYVLKAILAMITVSVRASSPEEAELKIGLFTHFLKER